MTVAGWGRAMLARFREARLRTQLLLVVNLSIAAVLSGFVVADYQRAVAARLRDKRIALAEEARTIEMAVHSLRGGGTQAVQQFIDATCSTMNARESPGHTIEVTLGGTTLAADPSTHGHDHASASAQLVWGESGDPDLGARVGERRGPVLAAVRRAELGRVGAILLAGTVGAVVLNVLLMQLVTDPMERMVRAVRDIGRGRLGTTVDIHTSRELGELAGEVSRMSLDLARRDADRRAQLNRARRLQSHLIPAPARDAGLSVAIEYHPADEIAGDFVDVIGCPNGDTLLCVADVVGHGIHAAMGSAVLKALLLAADLSEPSPAKILSAINRRYWATSLPEDFASMVLVRVSATMGTAVYASAGHEIGFIRHESGQCEDVPSTGLVLGVDPDAVCADGEITLGPGGLLVLLSDGVTETQDERGRLLGRSRVAQLIGAAVEPDTASLARMLIDAADRHRGNGPRLDDITVLALGLAPTGRRATAGTHDQSNATPSSLTDTGTQALERRQTPCPPIAKEMT